MHHCVSKRPKWIKKRPWMAHLNKPSRSTSCYARSSGIVVPSDKQQWYKKNRLSRKHYQTLTDKVVRSVAKCCNKKQPNYFQKLTERLPQQFLLKKCRLKLVRKGTKYLGYFVVKTFQKWPNLITLVASGNHETEDIKMDASDILQNFFLQLFVGIEEVKLLTS